MLLNFQLFILTGKICTLVSPTELCWDWRGCWHWEAGWSQLVVPR